MLAGSVLLALLAAACSSSVGGARRRRWSLGTVRPRHRPPVLGRRPAGAGRQRRAARPATTRAFGYYTFAASLGQALGPGADRAVRRAAGDPRHLGALRSAPSGSASAVLVAVGAACGPPARHVAAAAADGGMRALLRLPGLVRRCWSAASCWPPSTSRSSTCRRWAPSGASPPASIGVLLTLRAVASMTSRLFLGRLVGRLGRRRLLDRQRRRCPRCAMAALRRAHAPVGAGRGRRRCSASGSASASR